MIMAENERRRNLGMEICYPDFPAVGQVSGRIDTYMKMVQLIQRRKKKHLYLEVNKQNLIWLNIPKGLICKCNDTVSLKAYNETRYGMIPFIFNLYL